MPTNKPQANPLVRMDHFSDVITKSLVSLPPREEDPNLFNNIINGYNSLTCSSSAYGVSSTVRQDSVVNNSGFVLHLPFSKITNLLLTHIYDYVDSQVYTSTRSEAKSDILRFLDRYNIPISELSGNEIDALFMDNGINTAYKNNSGLLQSTTRQIAKSYSYNSYHGDSEAIAGEDLFATAIRHYNTHITTSTEHTSYTFTTKKDLTSIADPDDQHKFYEHLRTYVSPVGRFTTYVDNIVDSRINTNGSPVSIISENDSQYGTAVGRGVIKYSESDNPFLRNFSSKMDRDQNVCTYIDVVFFNDCFIEDQEESPETGPLFYENSKYRTSHQTLLMPIIGYDQIFISTGLSSLLHVPTYSASEDLTAVTTLPDEGITSSIVEEAQDADNDAIIPTDNAAVQTETNVSTEIDDPSIPIVTTEGGVVSEVTDEREVETPVAEEPSDPVTVDSEVTGVAISRFSRTDDGQVYADVQIGNDILSNNPIGFILLLDRIDKFDPSPDNDPFDPVSFIHYIAYNIRLSDAEVYENNVYRFTPTGDQLGLTSSFDGDTRTSQFAAPLSRTYSVVTFVVVYESSQASLYNILNSNMDELREIFNNGDTISSSMIRERYGHQITYVRTRL